MIASASRSADGHAFWRVTFWPTVARHSQARTLTSPSTVTRQFGQSPPTQYRPRGRWYLKDREKMRVPPR